MTSSAAPPVLGKNSWTAVAEPLAHGQTAKIWVGANFGCLPYSSKI